jgi:hypothetical protein
MTTVRHGAKMTLREYRGLGPVDGGMSDNPVGVEALSDNPGRMLRPVRR